MHELGTNQTLLQELIGCLYMIFIYDMLYIYIYICYVFGYADMNS